MGCSPWSVWDLRYQPWRFGHLPAAIILLSILAFSGCGRARPSDAELAGTYVPDAETRTIATRDAKGSQPTVVLKADGTCTLSDMPGWWLFADPPDPPWSGTGTWRFEENGDGHGWQVFIHVSRCSSGLNILGSQPPYALGTWVDDPDTGQFVRFVKREYADSPARRDQAMH